jgi:APA family basic amino acid/polyamine antiporter
VGFLASLYLVLPLSGRPLQQYVLAGALVTLGVALFGVTVAINRALGITTTRITDVESLDQALVRANRGVPAPLAAAGRVP